MKLVIQRVKKANVTLSVSGEVVGTINKGLFVLLGIKKGDTKEVVDYLVQKLLKLRIMSDEEGKMNLSVISGKSSLLVVSQFTLYANTSGGNRPSFIDSEEPERARYLYDYFVEKLKETGINVQTGKFGEYMKIKTFLDGPVTIILEN